MFEDKEKLDDTELMHYGTPQLYPGDPHGSGRYREGSGTTPNQHGSDDFITRVSELHKSGMTQKEIADALGISTTELRVRKSIAVKEQRAQLVARAEQLKKQGYTNTKIAELMGLKGESTVRSLLNADSKARMTIAEKTAANLAKLCDERGMIDVGVGVEKFLGDESVHGIKGISQEKLKVALEILQAEGYEVYGGRVPQVTNPGKYTTIKVLCPPGTEHKDIYNYGEIHSITDLQTRDGGDTLERSFTYPESMSSSRLAIRYAEDGGADRDGQVEIRKGVKDLYLGDGVNYAQVRILVDGTHYIKGMAVYSDDLPDGVDVLFNSNKRFADKGPDKLNYLKSIKDNIAKDPDNPFGSAIKERGGQMYYDDPDGKYTDPSTGHKQSLSLINKRAEEGDWGDWADTVPSQFLSKQPLNLIQRQLKESYDEKKVEYDEIMELTNPTIKRSFLETFAENCDSASVELKAAAFAGQKYQVILPLTTLGDKEVYAPSYPDGSTVALVRYPHGGTFEIPVLTVNNRNEEGIKNLTTTPKDAIGINSKVAARLSGADFDGDTVMVIPFSDRVKINSTKQLDELKDFDTKLAYGADTEPWTDDHGVTHYSRGGKEYKIMSNTQTQMGIISNLITDMTLGGATPDELARAVKHSMVVIDAEKHKLDYKSSEIDNNIASLKAKYQGHIDAEGHYREGASTLISRANSEIDIPERKPGAYYTKDTLEKVIHDPQTNTYTVEKTGEKVLSSRCKILLTDPETGEKTYRDTGRVYYKVDIKDANGKKQTVSAYKRDNKYYYKDETGLFKEVPETEVKVKLATEKSTRMAETKNAYTLSRGSKPEEAYAEYANSLKALANQARLDALAIKDIPQSADAKVTYRNEIVSLKQKLNEALMNAPREREAQLIANSIIKAKLDNAGSLTSEQEMKIKQQALARARKQVGAKRTEVEITENEWKAIQAGAIAKTTLKQIIDHANDKILKELATPRTTTTLSIGKVSRIKSMSSRGYTIAEIAKALGISPTTVIKYLKGKE